jgi:polysaccharide export outer membrane protein
MLNRFVAAVAVCLVIGGCATRQPKLTPAEQAAQEKAFPTLQDLGQGAEMDTGENLRLRAGDTMEVRLGGVPREEIEQVTGTYTVDTQGYVNMPQIGRVRAAGLAQETVQAAIEKKYRESGVYTNPTVTVVVPMSTRFVNVGGEVRLPQRIPYTPDLTVLAAVSAAGGFTEYASQSRMRLYRGTKVVTINMREIRKNPANDVPLQPGDTIEVMRSFF